MERNSGDALVRWTEAKTPQELVDYRCRENAVSVDGLPALDPQPDYHSIPIAEYLEDESAENK